MFLWIGMAGLVAFFLWLYKKEEGRIGAEGVAYSLFFGSVAGGLIGLLVALIVSWFVPTETIVDETPLVAMSSGSETEGSMFLFAGSVDEEPVYQYLSVREDGGILRDWVDADKSVVFENSDRDPVLIETVENLDYWWLLPWGINSGYSAEFYVPEGSVSRDFEVTP